MLEFIIRSSPKILYNCISSPSGLASWFADDVNIKDDVYTFFWDDSQQDAKLIGKKANNFIRFRWLDEPDDTYFEFKVEVADLTSDVILFITDFADSDEDAEEAKRLWDSQVHQLMHNIGS